MRFGRSSWELKIDPKRLQERIKNDFEKDITTRYEKKDNKDDKKRQYELPKCFDTVWPGNQGRPGKW